MKQEQDRLDVDEVRAQFPILSRQFSGSDLVYLDNAATTQKPKTVIEGMSDFLSRHNAPVHRATYDLAAEASEIYEQSRQRVARFLGVSDREIIFTRNATEAINTVASAWLDTNLKQGDLIVLTEMEHHSNIVPWYLAARRAGARIEWLSLTDDGRLDEEHFLRLLEREPRIVSLAHVSNVLGTVNPVKDLVSKARSAGAMTLVDGAQAASRIDLDLLDIGADFYVFSAHKLYGPTGIGVLHGRLELLEEMEPTEGGGSMIDRVEREKITWAEVPRRFEAGTPPIAEALGLARAIEWIDDLGIERIRDHEQMLLRRTLFGLESIDGLEVFGPKGAKDREAIVSFAIEGIHPHDVSEILNRSAISVRSGHHCAEILMNTLGVPALTRASFAPYNQMGDVDALLEGIAECQRIFA